MSSTAGLVAALDALACDDVAELSTVDVRGQLLDLLAASNRLHAELLRRVDVFDARGASVEDAARSTVSWLRAFGRMSAQTASGQVRQARLLRDLPALASVAATGQASADHLSRVVRLSERVGVEVVACVDPIVAQAATELDPTDLGRVCDRVRAHVDPDGAQPDAAEDFARRGLTFSPFDGMVLIRGQLDPEGGAALMSAIDALSAPPAQGEMRSPAQRRADAMVELARLALREGWLPTVGGVRPQVAILVGPEALRRDGAPDGGPHPSPRPSSGPQDLPDDETPADTVPGEPPPTSSPPTDPVAPDSGQAAATRADLTPYGSVPTGSTPAGSAPDGLVPTGSTPAGSAPDGLVPTGSAAAGSAADGLVSTGSALYGSVPTGSVPTGSVPTGSASDGSTPTDSAPTGLVSTGSTSAARRIGDPVPDFLVETPGDPAVLDWVGEIPDTVAQRIVCDADIWRIVMDPASGRPLDVGRSYRLVTHWIRKALHARDRGCRFPGCHPTRVVRCPSHRGMDPRRPHQDQQPGSRMQTSPRPSARRRLAPPVRRTTQHRHHTATQRTTLRNHRTLHKGQSGLTVTRRIPF